MACRYRIPRNSCHTFQCPPRWTLPLSLSGLDCLRFPSPEPWEVTHPPHVVTAWMKSQMSEAQATLSECLAMCLLWSWHALSFLLARLWPQRFKLPITCPPITLNAGNFINHYFLDENTEQREVKSFPLQRNNQEVWVGFRWHHCLYCALAQGLANFFLRIYNFYLILVKNNNHCTLNEEIGLGGQRGEEWEERKEKQ